VRKITAYEFFGSPLVQLVNLTFRNKCLIYSLEENDHWKKLILMGLVRYITKGAGMRLKCITSCCIVYELEYSNMFASNCMVQARLKFIKNKSNNRLQ
jgi:hypothetical protein